MQFVGYYTIEVLRECVLLSWKHRFLQGRELAITAVFLLAGIWFTHAKDAWAEFGFIALWIHFFWILRFCLLFKELRVVSVASIAQLKAPIQFTLQADGIISSSPGFQCSPIQWQQVVGRVVERSEMIVLILKPRGFFLLPLQALNEGDKALVHQTVSQHLDANQKPTVGAG